MRDATAPNQPCTLSRSELDQCDPRQSGGRIRARCPLHGSDHQRSLSVDPATGRWHCFACQRWGHITDWPTGVGARSAIGAAARPVPAAPKEAPRPLPAGLRSLVQEWRQALREATGDHPAAAYIRERGIPQAVAVGNGWGACLGSDWPGRREAPELQPWREPGRWALVAPTWAPTEEADARWQPINIYARIAAVGVEPRHDFLPGGKGLLLARPVEQVHPELVLVEGPADALAFAAAGHRAIALLGSSPAGVPWGALPDAPLVIATDYDSAGRGAAVRLLVAALRAGREARVVASDWFAGAKDAAELRARAGALPPLRYAEPPADVAHVPLAPSRPVPASPRPAVPASARPVPRERPALPVPVSTAPVAPAARRAPADPLVERWAEERCRRRWVSAEISQLFADFRRWAPGTDVELRSFVQALLRLDGVETHGSSIAVGLETRFGL